MELRNIGSLEVSVVGVGCNNFGWRIDAAGTQAVVDAALEEGINFFDTADMYGTGQSEEYLGRALGSRRQKAIVASKFGLPMGDGRSGAKPAYIRQAVEDSLRRLGTDRIDLYQLHKPDPATPIGETLATLDELVRAGKVREIGCSNFSVEQLREALGAVRAGTARFVSVQNEYSLVQREPEDGVLGECRAQGMSFLPYFPLANGLLSGKYRRGAPLPPGSRGGDGWGPKIFTDANLAKAEDLARFAEEHGHTLLELAVSWLAAQNPIASVIAGAKTPDQVRSNARAAGWRLGLAEVTAIGSLAARA